MTLMFASAWSEAQLTIGMGMLMVAPPFAVVTAFNLPVQKRERQLLRRGVRTQAVCSERLYRGTVTVGVRCTYYRRGYTFSALVKPSESGPVVGEEFEILYDPEGEAGAENAAFLEAGGTWRSNRVMLALTAGLATMGTLLVLL